MLTMAELLKDKTYREFLKKKPETPPATRYKSMSPMWVVYVQPKVDGPWKRKSFYKYSDAFKFLVHALKAGIHDAALNNKRLGFRPPSRRARIKGRYIVGSDGVKRQATKYVEWKPKLDGIEQHHEWCMYCRRPTIFKNYRRHPALAKTIPSVDPSIRRCCICGASERIAILPERRRV